MSIPRLLLFLAAAVSVVPPAVSRAQSASATDASLQPGDAVRIMVWRRPELSGEYQVSPDGTVADPFYLPVRVSGVPFSQVSDRVREFVAQYQENPRVFVQPLLRVVVGGDVRTPNQFLVRPDVTLLQAVILAGGASEQGRLDRVDLYRNGRRQTIDLSDAGNAAAHQPVRSGDELIVRRRSNTFRDLIAPAASVLGVAASIVIIARQN